IGNRLVPQNHSAPWHPRPPARHGRSRSAKQGDLACTNTRRPKVPSPGQQNATILARRTIVSGIAQLEQSLRLAAAAPTLRVGLVAGLLSWLSPITRPTLVGLWVNEYQSRQLPSPAHGLQDKQALLQSGLFAQVAQPAAAGPERHMLVRELKALANRSANETV